MGATCRFQQTMTTADASPEVSAIEACPPSAVNDPTDGGPDFPDAPVVSEPEALRVIGELQRMRLEDQAVANAEIDRLREQNQELAAEFLVRCAGLEETVSGLQNDLILRDVTIEGLREELGDSR